MVSLAVVLYTKLKIVRDWLPNGGLASIAQPRQLGATNILIHARLSRLLRDLLVVKMAAIHRFTY